MVVMGLAVQRAAQDAKRQLLQCAGKVLKQKAEDLYTPQWSSRTRRMAKAISFSKVIVDFFGSKAGEIIAKGLYKDKSSTRPCWAPRRRFGKSVGAVSISK